MAENRAQVALYFGGDPVVGSIGVQADFSAAAINNFQDLITKVWGSETGNLAAMGPVPNREDSQLHITQLVHGSFGFLFEELDEQGEPLFETPLRKAADVAVKVISNVADPNEARFTAAIEDMDQRVFKAVKNFIASMHRGRATFRIPVLSARRDECSILEKAVAILFEEDRYPTHDKLAVLIGRAGIVEASIVDLQNMLRVVASTEPFLEHALGRRSAVYSGASVVPDGVVTRLGGRLGAAAVEFLMLAALANEDGWCTNSTYWATSAWGFAEAWIEASGRAGIVELMNGDLLDQPRDVNTTIQVLRSAVDLELRNSVTETYTDPPRAVRTVLLQLQQLDSTIDASAFVNVAVGFVASIKDLNIHNQVSVLETVFQRAALAAIGRLHLMVGAKLHPVRTAADANAPQVERGDGAKLWRCMVTKTGAGYRLHYWSLPGGGIELEEVCIESVT